MENSDKIDIKNGDTKYKEVKINKMIVNGKEQEGNIISAEDSKEKQELNVTVYTQEIDSEEIDTKELNIKEIETQEIDTNEIETHVIETKEINAIQKKRKGISMIHELFKKGIFHRKRN